MGETITFVCTKCGDLFRSSELNALYCHSCELKKIMIELLPEVEAGMETLCWDGLGNDLVRDIETNEVLEVNWSNEKMREYVNDNEKIIKQLTAKNLKLKRKTKKLRREVEYWKNQAELLTKGLGYIRAEYSINGVAKAMATKTLDEYYQNEFDKKQKDEMKKGVGYWQGNQHD